MYLRTSAFRLRSCLFFNLYSQILYKKVLNDNINRSNKEVGSINIHVEPVIFCPLPGKVMFKGSSCEAILHPMN